MRQEALADFEPGTTVRDVDVQPAGFTTAMIEVTKVDGTVCELCMWLADTGDERGRGLKGVTSLGTPEGMAFVWNEPTTGSFFMFQTVTPLSIAWFGSARRSRWRCSGVHSGHGAVCVRELN